MPRLKQVPLAEAMPTSKRYYEKLFSGRDPVKEPGTATGTPGNWWTVFALVPPSSITPPRNSACSACSRTKP